jgi:hypothetical protein
MLGSISKLPSVSNVISAGSETATTVTIMLLGIETKPSSDPPEKVIVTPGLTVITLIKPVKRSVWVTVPLVWNCSVKVSSAPTLIRAFVVK